MDAAVVEMGGGERGLATAEGLRCAASECMMRGNEQLRAARHHPFGQ